MITLECELGIRILIVPSPFCIMPSGSVHCRLQRRSLVAPMGVEGCDEGGADDDEEEVAVQSGSSLYFYGSVVAAAAALYYFLFAA